MSYGIVSRALEAPGLTPAETLVLVILAEFADDSGRCWPSLASVARKAKMTERGVRGIIRRLEEAGHVATEISKGRGSNRYLIAPNPEPPSGFNGSNPEPRSGSNPEPPAGSKAANPERRCTQPGTAVPPNRQEPPIAAAAGAQAREREELDAIRKAVGARSSGRWGAGLALCVDRWRALGLTDSEIAEVVSSTARGRRINAPEYFNAAMEDFAGRKAARPLSPSAAGPPRRASSGAAGSGVDGILKRYERPTWPG